MFHQLIRFEWLYHSRRPFLYIAGLAFFIIGMMAGSSSGITFPNIYANSPYQTTYLVGIFSLAVIFPVTFLIAQHFLREQDAHFDQILYATPVKKFNYLTSRITGITSVSILIFIPVVAGLFTGQLLFPFPGDKTGPYNLLNYLWPLLVLAIPNILFCVAVLCSMAWITKNKLIIYVTGLCIYIFYIIGSIFSNSPLIAGTTIPSDESMSLFAKLDPFGMAAFFEQTRYWTAVERNTEQLSLSGNFLLNRIGTLLFSVILLAIAYWRYQFRLTSRKSSKTRSENNPPAVVAYSTVEPLSDTSTHFTKTIFTFIRTDLKMIIKGIPLIMIAILWTVLLIIELVNGLSGPAGMGTRLASTGEMITIIMDTFPFFSLLVILFYSSELIWRSKTVKIDQIEDATPYPSLARSIAKYGTITLIPAFLLLYSCCIGVAVQLFNGVSVIQWDLYVSMFYYLGLPAMLSVMLIVSIQQLVPSKYGGLALAAVVIFLTQSVIGKMIGITHPMLRYAAVMDIPYSDMNRFGQYSTSFHYLMLYWTSVAWLIALVANRKYVVKSRLFKISAFAGLVVMFLAGGFIFYHTNIKSQMRSDAAVNRHKQEYEQRFKKYAHLPQPVITAVQTTIDLYPDNNSYSVKGSYVLKNNDTASIDSLLLFIADEIRIEKVVIEDALVAADESDYGHYWYKMKQPLAPGDSLHMEFSFSSSWQLFTNHVSFNSIVENGTFIRISNYFPEFGYQLQNELTNSIERNKRKMAPQEPLLALDALLPDSTDYNFIQLDMTISTSSNQIAIGTGEPLNNWKKNNRNYFRYVSDKPIPFRFAVASATYSVKKDHYNKIPIEVYYHPSHSQNVEALISDIKTTIAYCEENFAPYPHRSIRFAEISSFAEGFAATAYPGVIFMKENGGFSNNLKVDNSHDIINQLAGHELSHEWWGSASLQPHHREGGWVLTETLAKYTELMLYKKEHGVESTSDIIKYHAGMYFSNRSFSKETPLYKTTFETPHLPYNKGTIVMYQLERLIGEEKINDALSHFFRQHRFPNRPPVSEDLLRELYRVAPIYTHPRIDELFKQIIIYDNKIEAITARKLTNGMYELSYQAGINKIREDGSGNQQQLPADGYVQVLIENADGSKSLRTVRIKENKISEQFIQKGKPVQLIVDPYFDFLDAADADNKKRII